MAVFSTTGNDTANVANSLAKIFVGDPKADAAYRNQQIKNDTEFLRQKQIQEQTLSEAARTQLLTNQANNQQADFDRKTGELEQQNAFADIFTKMQPDTRTFDQAGGQSVAGDLPAGAPQPFDINKQGPQALQHFLKSGLDESVLSSLNLMGGMDQNTMARIMTASGRGADTVDRGVKLGSDQRLVDPAGGVIQGMDPSAIAKNLASAEKTGGKIPKLSQQDLGSMIRNAIAARGAKFGDEQSTADFLSAQPEIFDQMNQVVDASFAQGGGRASAVQNALSQLLGDADFSQFGEKHGFMNLIPGGDVAGELKAPVELNNIQEILANLQQGGQQDLGQLFSGGGVEDIINSLPDRQNVGTVPDAPTATGPNGEKIVLRNGKWEPL